MKIKLKKYSTQDREKLEAWAEALLSGQFGQTTGTLHRGATDGFCCLGVSCLLGISKPDFMGVTVDKSFAKLSEDDLGACVEMNDGLHWTFNQIGSAILLSLESGISLHDIVQSRFDKTEKEVNLYAD